MESISWGFSEARNLIGRHKRKLMAGTAIAAGVGGYYAYQKYMPLVREFRAQMKLMQQLEAQAAGGETESQHAALRQQLSTNLSVGDLTLCTFATKLRQQIQQRFPVEELRKQMAKSKGKRTAEDLAVWEQFKNCGFARTLAALYSILLTNALTKVQVSVFSRYITLDMAQKTTPELKLQQEKVNEQYLSFAEYFQSTGVIKLCDKIEQACEKVLARCKLTMKLDHDTLMKALADIRVELEPEIIPHISYLLPVQEEMKEQINHFKESLTANYNSNIAPPTPTPTPSPPTPTADTALSVTPTLPDSATPPEPAQPPPDPAKAAQRLHEMLEETRLIITSASFTQLISQLGDGAFNVLSTVLLASWGEADEQVFAKAMMKVAKAFQTILPEATDRMPESPLFVRLANSPELTDFCSIIFLPLDVTLKPSQPLIAGADFNNPLAALTSVAQ